MINKLPRSQGNVLGYKIAGQIHEEDYTQLRHDIKQVLAEHDSFNLYAEMDFEGIDLNALDDDIRMVEYMDDIERYAVVSDNRVFDWLTSAADAVLEAKMKHFDPDQREEAWTWIKTGQHQAAT